MNDKKLMTIANRVLDYSAGMTISASIYLGDKLGLYKALQHQPPTTSTKFAQSLGLHERWITEWLRGQVAASLIDYDQQTDCYHLSPEAACILADDASNYFQAGSFTKILSLPTIIEHLETSFRTGKGFSFDIAGAMGAAEVEKTFAPWYKTIFIDTVLPALDGVEDKLKNGACVADIGCGAGVAIIEMAKKFPCSQFFGYDISIHALARAEKNKSDADIANVIFINNEVSPLPNQQNFDIITIFDALHDMNDPRRMLIDIKKMLKPNGTLFITDLNTKNSFAQNLADNPFAKHMYSWSLLYCLPSGLSQKNGAGLGALGLSEEKLVNMLNEVDMHIYKRHDFGNPLAAYYEIKIKD